MRRKAAGTLRALATGRSAHSGSAPDQGANALLALARTAVELARLHQPTGADRLSVVPTVVRSGNAFNVVPARGELIFDLRADRIEAFDDVVAAVPGGARRRRAGGEDGAGVAGDGRPRGDRAAAGASERAGSDGGSSGWRAAAPATRATSPPAIPLTIDGLGPRGGGAHTPEEFVLAASLRERAEVAMAIAVEALEGAPGDLPSFES